MEDIKRAKQRIHPEEFKRQVLSECAQPGASVERIAKAYELSPGLVHRWRRARRDVAAQAPGPAAFVPVKISAPLAGVRIELQREALKVTVHWPVSAASECAAWLREVLR